MYSMAKIQRWFENKRIYNSEYYNLTFYGNSYEALGYIIRYLFVAPNEGTNYMWMVRISTIAAFDRWANSVAIERFFNSEEEVISYLNNNQLEIYKVLLSYLSEEYEEYRKSEESM